MKNILIVGGEFSNKGAALMIYSAQKQIKAFLPDSRLFLSPTLASLQKIENSGFEPLNFPLFHVGYKSPKVFNYSLKYPFLMKRYIELRKWASFKANITLKEIDIVFDISGYAFALKWGMTPVLNLNSLMNYVVNHNGKYIFLPQAFGPFSEEQLPIIRECIKKSTLAISRDQTSYKNLIDLGADSSKIKKYPDITLSFKVDTKETITKDKYCCIVPNIRMLDRGGVEWKKEYLNLLEFSIEYILENSDCNIRIVNHSKLDDRKLVSDFGDKYKSEVRVSTVFEEDPLVLKLILSNSYFTLASRFHAVASSLSSNVPCIMTSWSHKYQELAKDFGVGEFCLQKPDQKKLSSLLDGVIESDKNNLLRLQLESKNKENIELNQNMWNLIKEVLK